ncbi:MAG: isochorismatase family protein [Lysobacteraceae bacterium]
MDSIPSRITPDNAALVLVDYNVGLFEMVHPSRKRVIREGAIALSKMGEAFARPTLVLGEGVDISGPLVPEITERHRAAPHVRRSTFSAWDAEEFARTIEGFGRRKIILAGIATDVCVLITALDLLRHGYEVYLVADASGSQDPIAEQAALLRASRAGVVLTGWVGLIGEMMGDWNSKYAADVKGIFETHIPAVLEART